MPMNRDGIYGKYIIQDIILPPERATPEAGKEYEELGRRRILWLDALNMPCSGIQMNTAWYVHANRDIEIERRESGASKGTLPHVHDVDELLGFLGSNPDDPSDLCGEIELHIDGEPHILTKSSYVFIPAGVKHVPLYINRVDRPIFHFSLLLGPQYVLTRDADK